MKDSVSMVKRMLGTLEVWRVIDYLREKAGYASQVEIASATGLNSRTVKDMMPEVRDVLEKEGFELVSVRSKGYQIRAVYPAVLDDLKSACEDNLKIFTQEDTRISELEELLSGTSDFWKIDDLADLLFVSRSAINQDMQEVKKNGLKYGISYEKKPGKGIRICGTERSIRRQICDLNFNFLKQDKTWPDQLFGKKSSLEKEILEILNGHSFFFSDIALIDFMSSLSMALYRFARGFEINEFEDPDHLVSDEAISAACEITDLITRKTGMILSYPEIREVALQILSKRTYREGMDSPFNELKQTILDELIQAIYDRYRIRFTCEKSLRIKLSALMESFFYHMRFGTRRRNSLYGTEETDPVASFLSDTAKEIIEKHCGEKLGTGDWLRLVSVFKVIEIRQLHHRSNVLLVGSIDRNNVDLIEYFIPEKNGRYIEKMDSCTYYRYYPEIADEYDLLVTPLADLQPTNKPVVSISPFLSTADHARITKALKKIATERSFPLLFGIPQILEMQDLYNQKDLVSLAGMLEPFLNKPAVQIKKSVLQGLKTSFFNFRNGIAICICEPSLNGFDQLIPIRLKNQKEFQILFLVSLRHEERAIPELLYDLFSGIEKQDFSQLSYLELLDLLLSHLDAAS